ncbi:MAG: DNA polymerase III subunit delta [Halanaerobiales bacterium]
MADVKSILNKTKDKLDSIYLIHAGNLIMDRFKENFIEKFIDEDNDFNYTYLNQEEDFAVKLKNYVNTPPFMADKRYIITKVDDYFSNKYENHKLLIQMFNNFPETTILIILSKRKINKKLKVVEALKKNGTIIEEALPKYRELDNWIRQEFEKRGKKIKYQGLKLLEQMFNNNLQQLENEIKKICLYKNNLVQITYNDIIAVISKDRLVEDNLIFSLTDAIMAEDKGKAIELLRDIIEDGVFPLRILATIIWQLRLLLSVKSLKDEGKTVKEIAHSLKVHQYPVKKCYKKSNNFTEEEIELMLENFFEANVSIITGKCNPDMALELAIIK